MKKRRELVSGEHGAVLQFMHTKLPIDKQPIGYFYIRSLIIRFFGVKNAIRIEFIRTARQCLPQNAALLQAASGGKSSFV